MYKFTNGERSKVKSLIASLSIKRIPDLDIIKTIYEQTGESISTRYYYNLKSQIEKESYQWYHSMRQSQFSYIHEFKSRINEILDLQQRHHKIIDSPTEPTSIKQKSLEELHRLNITLSNYFAVVPTVIHDFTLSAIPAENNPSQKAEPREFIV